MSIISRGFNRCLALPLRGLPLHRFVSSKQAAENPGTGCCDADLGPICGGGGDKKGEKSKKDKTGKRPQGPEKKKISEECMDDPCCPDPAIPYDEEFKDQLAFKPRTDFQKTWVECPPHRVVQKVVCCEPEEESTCPREKPDCLPAPKPECDKVNPKCPKITMPGCKPAMQHKDRCKVYPVPSDCEKIKAPYPSFSECARPKPKPLHPTECECLAMRSMCEVYTYYRKHGMKMSKKGGK